jgi:NADP-dependent 3-hydroxy acid dehydrogenase YdfG
VTMSYEYKLRFKHKSSIFYSQQHNIYIVITGASSGIGKQAALDFVNEDAGSIIVIARLESKLLELKRTLQVVNEPRDRAWHQQLQLYE